MSHFAHSSTDGHLSDFYFFPGGTSSKEPTCQCRRHKRHGFIPVSRRSPGEGNGNPLQYSCLENPMDRRAWWATVHGVPKSQTQLKRLSIFRLFSTKLLWIFSDKSMDICFHFINSKSLGLPRWHEQLKNPPVTAGDIRDTGSIPGGEHGNPLLYSCLENPMERGA